MVKTAIKNPYNTHHTKEEDKVSEKKLTYDDFLKIRGKLKKRVEDLPTEINKLHHAVEYGLDLETTEDYLDQAELTLRDLRSLLKDAGAAS